MAFPASPRFSTYATISPEATRAKPHAAPKQYGAIHGTPSSGKSHPSSVCLEVEQREGPCRWHRRYFSECLSSSADGWKLFLRDSEEEEANKIRGHERTGRALGTDSFLESLELTLMRTVKRRKIGRKQKVEKYERVSLFLPFTLRILTKRKSLSILY